MSLNLRTEKIGIVIKNRIKRRRIETSRGHVLRAPGLCGSVVDINCRWVGSVGTHHVDGICILDVDAVKIGKPFSKIEVPQKDNKSHWHR